MVPGSIPGDPISLVAAEIHLEDSRRTSMALAALQQYKLRAKMVRG